MDMSAYRDLFVSEARNHLSAFNELIVRLEEDVTDREAIDEILAREAGQVEEYRSGKDKLFGFFVGQVMKASKGKANPAVVNELLLAKLKG